MAEKYYLDTSVWIDFHEKRGKNGEAALKLLTKIIEQDNILVYSDMTVKEFKQIGYSQNEINSILKIAKPDHIKRIHINKEQREEAKKLASQRNIPKADALHAILARDNELQLIARDPHFKKLKDITNSKIPEDFI